MNTIYRADDGTEFYSADACLAYEEKESKQCEKWQQLVTRKQGGQSSELLEFLGEISYLGSSSYNEPPEIGFSQLKDFWPYRQRFVELGRTFIEAEPTLSQLLN